MPRDQLVYHEKQTVHLQVVELQIPAGSLVEASQPAPALEKVDKMNSEAISSSQTRGYAVPLLKEEGQRCVSLVSATIMDLALQVSGAAAPTSEKLLAREDCVIVEIHSSCKLTAA